MAELLWQLTGSHRLRNATDRLEMAAAHVFATLWLWQERARQRRALARLDPALLRDIGLTHEEAACECAKPVWRP